MRILRLELETADDSERHFGTVSRALPAIDGQWLMRILLAPRLWEYLICCFAAVVVGPMRVSAQPPVQLVELPSLPMVELPVEARFASESASDARLGSDAPSGEVAASQPENREMASWPSRPAPLVVGLPTAYATNRDQLVVEPHVQFGESLPVMSDEMSLRWLQSTRPSGMLGGVLNEAPPFFLTQEELPSPTTLSETDLQPGQLPSVIEVAPIFEPMVASAPVRRRMLRSSEPGLGAERLAFSLFDIDSAQPFNNLRVRTVLGHRMHLPDRAEYFWGRTVDRRGPRRGESVLNYQDLRLRMETGANKFSASFELPLRAVDPVVNPNHAGLGDLQLITKTVLLSGEKWLFTQYFGAYMPTGAPSMGLGTGHVSLEPGFLFRNKWHEDTWLHGELKFWFPLGADPAHGGQVVKFASGVNRVWYETDSSAWLPSLELTSYTVLNGLARDASGALEPIDGDFIFYLTPGLRYAMDGRGDLGLFEIGSAFSLATTQDRFTDSTFTFELRWSW